MKDIFFVTNIRTKINDPGTVLVTGCFPCHNKNNYELTVRVNGKAWPSVVKENRSNDVRRKYFATNQNIDTEYVIEIHLEKNISEYRSLEVLCTNKKKCVSAYKWNKKRLIEIENTISHNLEMAYVQKDNLRIMGWVAASEIESIELLDERGVVDSTVVFGYRRDMSIMFSELPDDTKLGFEITFPKKKYESLAIRIVADGKKCQDAIDVEKVLAGDCITPKKDIKTRAKDYLHYNGIKASLSKAVNKYKGIVEEYTYEDYLKDHVLSADEIDRQKIASKEFLIKPKIAICFSNSDISEKRLERLVAAVREQTYQDFKVYREESVKWALTRAKEDYVLIVKKGVVPTKDALYEFVKCINNSSEKPDMIYADNDVTNDECAAFFEPRFKPDFSVDYLCSMEYIGDMLLVSKSLLKKVEVLDVDQENGGWFEYLLRLCENTKNILHIPKILYHVYEDCVEICDSKNAIKSIDDHYKRIGVKAHAVETKIAGLYRTVYELEEEPLVSIIIPNKDHTDDLDKCLLSLNKNNDYKNFEIIIVENNSVESRTFDYYKFIEKDPRVKVVTYTKEFNYSDINNMGVKEAKGDYILLLNNDTQIMEKTSIREMVGVCLREDVGAVGAALYYDDKTLQHAGVIIGVGGCAGHAFVGLPMDEPGYMNRAIAQSNVSCATAAALLVKKQVFDEVGGFDVKYKVAFNDVDLCLKIRKAGYLIVYNPYAKLFHFESKSRGAENTPEKIERFSKEVGNLEKDWGSVILGKDPYYNANLSLMDGSFSLNN